MDEKMELIAKYGVDVSSLDFSIEDFTVEELTEKFEAMKAAQETEELEKRFALTSNVVDEIRRALCADRITRDWGECSRYCYVDCDIEAGEVYCWDMDDGLLYGFAFSIDGDSIVLDRESKKRKKYVITDFEGGEQASPIAPVFELVEDKLKDYAELEAKFDAASSEAANMRAELDTLRRFKSDADNAAAKRERDEIFARFGDLNGIEAFESLKENCMDFDIESLEEKCFAIRGRNGSALKFSAKEKAPKLKVVKTEISNEPYGGLFVEYVPGGSN